MDEKNDGDRQGTQSGDWFHDKYDVSQYCSFQSTRVTG